jgi:hypothetical protein
LVVVVRRWGLLGLVVFVACGKTAHNGSSDSSGAAGGAFAADGGKHAMASAGASGAATASAGSGNIASGAGGTNSSAGGSDVSPGSGGITALAGASGGPLGLGPDPLPAGDPPGLVKTSNSYLVFSQLDPDTTQNSRFQLMFLDMQGNGQPVLVSVAGTRNTVRSVSRDRRAFVYAQVDPYGLGATVKPREDDLYLNLFTDSGYVPGALVGGFAGRSALHSPGIFDSTSRFVFVTRPFAPRGVDIIDTARNTRYYSQELSEEQFSFGWAPKGYLFTYTLVAKLLDTSRTGRRSYVAKLIEGGISMSQPLPVGLSGSRFTADGKRLFYTVLNGTDPISFGYVDPPSAPQQFFASGDPFNVTAGGTFFIENRESVLAVLSAGGDSQHQAVVRLYSDPARAPVTITDPLRGIQLSVSESGSLAAISALLDDDTQRTEIVRGTEHFKVSETKGNELSGAIFVGEHAVYFDHAETSDTYDIHYLDLEGSKLVDTVISKGREWPRNYCQWAIPIPGNRASYLYSQPAGPSGVRFMDLAVSGPSATRAIDVSDPSATIDECPLCNPAGDTCAYVERTATHSKVFSVHYGSSGPSEPKLIYESDESFKLIAAHL